MPVIAAGIFYLCATWFNLKENAHFFMNPGIQGWLRQYCEQRISNIPHESHEQWGAEEIIYRVLQPTGLMYGHPVQHPTETELQIQTWDAVERMKLIYTESLLHIGSLNLQAGLLDQDHHQVTEHLVLEINDYLLNIYPHLYQGRLTSSFQEPFYLAETLISKRLTVKTSLLKNYLANLFHNSLLFLDVFYFGRWIKGLGSSSNRKIRQEKENMRLAILEIMALAAYADQNIKKEERSLFEFFLQSADLSPEKESEARKLLESPMSADQIHVPAVDSWVIRKYLLEMAILVSWADKDMSDLEQDLIKSLGKKLHFSEDEIASSLLAVESFVLNNWKGMHYLVGKHDMERVGNRFVRRLKVFIYKNKDYVVQEINESKELVSLLGKSRKTSLSEDEKKIVSEQLMDILKTIPAFVIIALPFTFITLPILLSLLPKTAFPSAFQE